jgi:hypothetical protein
VGGQVEGVGDLVEERSFVLQGAEVAFAWTVLARVARAGADVAQLEVGADQRLEAERAERAAVVGCDRGDRLDVAVDGRAVGQRATVQLGGLARVQPAQVHRRPARDTLPISGSGSGR